MTPSGGEIETAAVWDRLQHPSYGYGYGTGYSYPAYGQVLVGVAGFEPATPRPERSVYPLSPMPRCDIGPILDHMAHLAK